MKSSIEQKLQGLLKRKLDIEQKLSDAGVVADQKQFQSLSKELHDISPVVQAYQEYVAIIAEQDACREMMQEDDAEMKALCDIEMQGLKLALAEKHSTIMQLLLPKDPDDDRNVYMEIRAGTGGDEASLFAGDLARMYQMFAQTQRWKWHVVQSNISEQGGYKEIVVHICGKHVYEKLKFESGTHRVQRVPTTESQGRIHTSACTIAILPEVEEVDEVELDPSTIRVDTYRSSGAGGQHVNTTDSAVRLTHIPTGVVVECQDERSQHKNRARAMSLLQAKILSVEREKQAKDRAEQRRLQVGSGDRSERIRTYNFPQGRVTDHRIGLTLYKLEQILQGELLFLLEPLAQEDQADRMQSLQDQ